MHYPTDINLLYDATRKVIQLTAQLCDGRGLSDWRQQKYNVRQVKRRLRIVQKKKRATGKTESQKEKCEEAVKKSHRDLIILSQSFLSRSEESLHKIEESGKFNAGDLAVIEIIHDFKKDAHRQIDQIIRRVFQGEAIPHDEKVFSLFQRHTEWISKGKAGVPVELGLRVCVIEDQHQFILHHQVMEKKTDDQVALSMVTETKEVFVNLSSCSFDKGFHSPSNQETLREQLDVVALKRKGKLSKKSQAIESSDEFKKAKHKHSAVESAINALEVHGLDKCRDHGIYGFKRYVALAIMTRNIHRIGDLLHRREQKKIARKNHRCRDGTFQLSA